MTECFNLPVYMSIARSDVFRCFLQQLNCRCIKIQGVPCWSHSQTGWPKRTRETPSDTLTLQTVGSATLTLSFIGRRASFQDHNGHEASRFFCCRRQNRERCCQNVAVSKYARYTIEKKLRCSTLVGCSGLHYGCLDEFGRI